jgi:tetratricopeptide (TPR) repeat protein
MGRCLHKLEKRNAAIKAYQDVVDYFPDDVRYAAAALYYIGESHGQNGDEEKKLATWARMVKDDEYVSQPRSGSALAYLGSEMARRGKFEEAVEYHWRTATAFLKSNERAAAAARNEVIAHYVLRTPNHEKLMEFYSAARGFDGRGHKVDAPKDDPRYWKMVMDTVLRNRENIEKSSAYWSSQMGDRFPEDDALRVAYFNVLLATEKDPAAWDARMEKQYAQKPATVARLDQWLEFTRDHSRRPPFFAKHSKTVIAGLDNKGKLALANRLRQPYGMHEEAQAVARTVDQQAMDDKELNDYARLLGNYEDEATVLRVLGRIKDKPFAIKARYDYFLSKSHRNAPYMEKALAEIPALEKIPAYSKDVVWTKAELLRNLGRHEEAIKAYQAANRQPNSTWEVANCQIALKQFDQAVKTVQGLESIGGSIASQASLRIADIYRSSGDKGKEVQQLRLVLRRYPKSGESSTAHDRLESYGVKVIGGEAEAED